MWVGFVDPCDFIAEEKGDILLREDGVQFLFVLIDLRRACITLCGGTEFVEQIAERRVFADVQTASETHPDLGRVVTAEHFPVLHKSDFHPLSCCRYGRAHTGHSSAHDHEAEPALVFGFGR